MSLQVDLGSFMSKFILAHVKSLSVGFFEILEDLKSDGYVNEEVYKRCRKKILDRAGAVTRLLENQLDEVEFKFKGKE